MSFDSSAQMQLVPCMVLLHAASPDVLTVDSIRGTRVVWYCTYVARWYDMVWALLMQRIVSEVLTEG